MGWTLRPSRYAEEMRKNHNKLVREVTIRTLRGVVLKSPVDTGRFRANWQVSEGSYDATVAGPEKGGRRRKNAKNSNLSSKIREIQGMEQKVLYVTNNLHYAEILESGSSAQAPNGMVALTLLEVNNWIKKHGLTGEK